MGVGKGGETAGMETQARASRVAWEISRRPLLDVLDVTHGADNRTGVGRGGPSSATTALLQRSRQASRTWATLIARS